jgi:threonine aldolase
MIAAMAEAATFPNSMDAAEDPVVCELEGRAAALLGKEAALLFPTCAMANLTAIMATCRPGERFIADAATHIITSEGGGAWALAGVGPQGVFAPTGTITAEAVAATIQLNPNRSPTTLICLENTQVNTGGTVMPIETMRDIRQIAIENGIPVHLDGSRLFNAAIFLGVSARTLADFADTVSLSLNKGLCAPVGAVLAGPKPVIERAVLIRHRLGGRISTAGSLAAAGTVALESMPAKLADDHRRAAALARALSEMPGVRVVSNVQTNIVFAEALTGLSGAEIDAALAKSNVRVLPLEGGKFRMVTYHDISDDDVRDAIGAFRSLFG